MSGHFYTSTFSNENLNALSITDDTPDPQLERSLSLKGAISLVIASIIGSGIFSSPGPILASVGSVGMSLVVWAGAGLLAICGALCYAELGCSMPQSGGEHPYFMRAYGSLPAFLFSWTGITVTRPASIAIIILVFAEYLARIFTLDPSLVGIRCIALACVVFLTAVNACSLAMADLIVKGCTVIKVGALAMIGLIGLVSIGSDHSEIKLGTLFAGSSVEPGDYAIALYSALWAYDGWSNLNLVAGELKNPLRNLPRALITGLVTVIICYLAANIAYCIQLELSIVKGSTSLAMDFGQKMFGSIGRQIVGLVIVGSTFGAASASLFSGARLSVVASLSGHAPAFLQAINARFKTPVNALLFQSVLTCIFVMTGSFESLVVFYSIVAWTFYFLAVLALIVLRIREPELDRPFRVWLIVPLAFCASSLFLFLSAIVQSPLMGGYALLFFSIGALNWYLVVRRGNSWESKAIQAYFYC